MNSAKTKSAFPANSELNNLAFEQIQAMLRSESSYARTRALIALGARLEEEAATQALLEAIADPTNIVTPAMNDFSVAMVGAMVALENGSPALYAKLRPVVAQLPATQQQDIFDYLLLATKTNYRSKLLETI